MSEPANFSQRVRRAARSLFGGLLSAVCAQTWMPGCGSGIAPARPAGEHKAQHD